MEVVLKILKRADELIRCRLYALESMYFVIGKYDCLMMIIHIDHREELDIVTDALEVVACTLCE